VLSLRARLRLFAEPLVGRPTVEGEESVYEFAARRLGPEIAERLVDPMVTGVYAGDARMTSMSAAFPQLARLEADYGSLVRGMIASLVTARNATAGRKGSRIGKLASFPEGMGELVRALWAQLDGAVQVGRRVLGLKRDAHGWTVEASGGDPLAVDRVVLATPAPATARLVAPLAPGAVEPLEGIPYAAAVVAVLGFPRAALPRELDGFGFLVPSREGRRVLGVVWCSVAFPSRAPEGQVLMRAILGGVRHPEIVTMGDEDLTRLVREELAATMGSMPEPSFVRFVRWPAAIPQYTLGHAHRVRAAQEALSPLRGLHLAGAALYGVSVPDCVDRAEALPAELLAGAD
jgi:oxygen-dependent protoporphyrinogen oxidase